MIIDPIKIFNKEIWPIIEGGKGIRVSDGGSAGAFAAENCIGTFSGVLAKWIDENGDEVPLVYKGKTRLDRHKELISYSIKAGISQAKIAFEKAKGKGRIHMNILWEMGGAQEILTGILEKASKWIHGITCGAGMPYKLAEITAKYGVSYFPIISSARAFNILWLRAYKKFAYNLGGVVYEDPWLAGGHNGLSTKEDPLKPEAPEARLFALRSTMNTHNLQHVPIIMAGGVWHLRDWKFLLDSKDVGLLAFQFGTRPLLTQESPISDEWKRKLLTLKKGDIYLNTFSPTGFHSSAVQNSFLEDLIERSATQIAYNNSENDEFACEIRYGPRKRKAYIKIADKSRFDSYMALNLEIMKTPDSHFIFVSAAKFQQIREDQVNCVGCLSQCRFSNWKDGGDHTTEKLPDPRSFCIQKTLMKASSSDSDIENNLMFSGHNGYKFVDDPFYQNGFIPTIKQLIKKIKEGN